MTNRYFAAAAEIEARIADLRGRVVRFTERGLGSRVPGVVAQIADLEAKLPALYATARWSQELHG